MLTLSSHANEGGETQSIRLEKHSSLFGLNVRSFATIQVAIYVISYSDTLNEMSCYSHLVAIVLTVHLTQ